MGNLKEFIILLVNLASDLLLGKSLRKNENLLFVFPNKRLIKIFNILITVSLSRSKDVRLFTKIFTCFKPSLPEETNKLEEDLSRLKAYQSSRTLTLPSLSKR